MTDEQHRAHERLLGRLPVRKRGDMTDPANWPERDRELTPDELLYAEGRINVALAKV